MAYTAPNFSDPNWDVSLQTLFDQIYDDVTAAGTGDAKLRLGTRAERQAYGSPYDGLCWAETDYNYLYKYESTTATWNRLGNEISGYVSGRRISYSSATAISVGAFAVDIQNQVYSLASSTTVTTISAAGTSHWEYLSVQAPSNGLVLSATEITHSATPPTWSATYKGWYNGNARCIGVVPVNASNHVEVYSQIGNIISLAQGRSILYTSTPATTLTALTTNLPVLDKLYVEFGGYITKASVYTLALYIMDGDATSNLSVASLTIADGNSDTKALAGRLKALTNSSQQVKYMATATSTVTIHLLRFTLPQGF